MIAERILESLSRPPAAGDYAEGRNDWDLHGALAPLRARFPDLASLVRGKRVLDFGCGAGWQSLALVREGAAFVLGVDINERSLSHARARAAELGAADDRADFATEVPPELQGTFDVVVTLDAMEHFAEPDAVLRQMSAALRPGGRILVSFGPPWMAPYGSHMHFFTRVPWVNLFFPEKAVMKVRARYRDDGATRYEEVESGLNRMTVNRFEQIVTRSGMRMERRDYRCVKGADVLARVPVVRELFVNNISCVLVPTHA